MMRHPGEGAGRESGAMPSRTESSTGCESFSVTTLSDHSSLDMEDRRDAMSREPLSQSSARPEKALAGLRLISKHLPTRPQSMENLPLSLVITPEDRHWSLSDYPSSSHSCAPSPDQTHPLTTEC